MAFMLTTIYMYLLFTLAGNGRQLNCHVATSMIENGRLGRVKMKNKLELSKESVLAKSAS